MLLAFIFVSVFFLVVKSAFFLVLPTVFVVVFSLLTLSYFLSFMAAEIVMRSEVLTRVVCAAVDLSCSNELSTARDLLI